MRKTSSTLADLLAEDLVRNDRTQLEQAAAIGVNRSATRSWVLGRAFPRPRMVGRIARALGVPVEEVQAAVEAGRQQNTEGAVR